MMSTLALCALQVLILVQSGNAPLDRPLAVGGTDEAFQYDDGTANWLTWGGLYRGVWFNALDFSPYGTGCVLDNLEFWFYHHSSCGWEDASSFYAELWNGGVAGPETMLDHTSITAAHYVAIFMYYTPPMEVEADFWGIINTEMSSGGWPSNMGDNTPNPVSHSFYGDDLVVWHPWVIQGSTANDYLIRANGTLLTGLDQTTWGSVKTLF
jgi:hypothetical protein